MEEQLSKIIEFLKKKRDLFLVFEQETDNVLSAVDTDEIISHMDRRQKLFEKIQRLDEKIAELLEECGPEVNEAICNRCARQGLPSDLASLYDASMEVKAVVNRIIANNSALEEILTAQKKSFKKLEQLNRSPSAAANRYSSTMLSTYQSRPHRKLGQI